MNRRILTGITGIVVAALVLGTGTIAYLHDEEASEGNFFLAGIIDLKDLDDGKLVWLDVKQLDSSGQVDWLITYHPRTTNQAHHMELQVRTKPGSFYNWDGESGSTLNTEDDFIKQFLVTEFRYSDTQAVDFLDLGLGYISDSADGNTGYVSLYDVINGGQYGDGVYRNLPTIQLGFFGGIGFNLSFGDPSDPSSPIPDEAHANYYQGDRIEIEIIIAACQAPGQEVLPLP